MAFTSSVCNAHESSSELCGSSVQCRTAHTYSAQTRLEAARASLEQLSQGIAGSNGTVNEGSSEQCGSSVQCRTAHTYSTQTRLEAARASLEQLVQGVGLEAFIFRDSDANNGNTHIIPESNNNTTASHSLNNMKCLSPAPQMTVSSTQVHHEISDFFYSRGQTPTACGLTPALTPGFLLPTPGLTLLATPGFFPGSATHSFSGGHYGHEPWPTAGWTLAETPNIVSGSVVRTPGLMASRQSNWPSRSVARGDYMMDMSSWDMDMNDNDQMNTPLSQEHLSPLICPLGQCNDMSQSIHSEPMTDLTRLSEIMKVAKEQLLGPAGVDDYAHSRNPTQQNALQKQQEQYVDNPSYADVCVVTEALKQLTGVKRGAGSIATNPAKIGPCVTPPIKRGCRTRTASQEQNTPNTERKERQLIGVSVTIDQISPIMTCVDNRICVASLLPGTPSEFMRENGRVTRDDLTKWTTKFANKIKYNGNKNITAQTLQAAQQLCDGVIAFISEPLDAATLALKINTIAIIHVEDVTAHDQNKRQSAKIHHDSVERLVECMLQTLTVVTPIIDETGTKYRQTHAFGSEKWCNWFSRVIQLKFPNSQIQGSKIKSCFRYNARKNTSLLGYNVLSNSVEEGTNIVDTSTRQDWNDPRIWTIGSKSAQVVMCDQCNQAVRIAKIKSHQCHEFVKSWNESNKNSCCKRELMSSEHDDSRHSSVSSTSSGNSIHRFGIPPLPSSPFETDVSLGEF